MHFFRYTSFNDLMQCFDECSFEHLENVSHFNMVLSASLIFELDVNLTSPPNYIKLFLTSYQNSRNDPAGITATICAIGLQNCHGSTDERSDVVIRRLSTETYTYSKVWGQ